MVLQQAPVLQTAAFENSLDYETAMPLLVDVIDVNIPEEPLVEVFYKFTWLLGFFHFRFEPPALRERNTDQIVVAILPDSARTRKFFRAIGCGQTLSERKGRNRMSRCVILRRCAAMTQSASVFCGPK